jgi:predicted amino acid dehydrogenase
MVNVPITSGNTFTVATSLEGIRLASQKIKSPLKDSCLGVVGIPGSIATTCARIMAKEVNRLVLIGRPGREEDLQRIAGEISQLPQATKSIKTSTDPNILKECQYIITVTSSINPIIEEKYLSPGTVICDVARPRDTFESLQNDPNFLVFEGGLVRVPGQNVDLGTNITGLLNRHDITFACEAETMMLAASGRLDLATISNEISENNVLAMALLAQELGFETVGLRGVWDEQIVGFMELRRIRARKEKINA